MQKGDAILTMNKWASEKRAFVFVIDFEMQDILLWEYENVPDNFLFDFNGFANYSSFHNTSLATPAFAIKPHNKQQYLEAFDKVKRELAYGNSFLLNLTGKSELITNLKLEDFFHSSKATYKLLLKNKFVCFSPEPFVRIKNKVISGYPMKGTIDASIPDAESIILNDPKEKAEHNTIVDLIRNDISQYAKKVSVPRFRYVQKIKSPTSELLQVSSEVRGTLDDNYKQYLGNIIFGMLPAGSISGAPKHKTVQIIKDAENDKRSYYTGIAGYFDGSNLDSCVMIRFIEKAKDKLFYRSGGGITFMSDGEKEYQELLDKIYVPTY